MKKKRETNNYYLPAKFLLTKAWLVRTDNVFQENGINYIKNVIRNGGHPVFFNFVL